ncbi:MAG TPA: site-specific integrase [Azospirillum sp.]|nr:site-specific integrase [Azospirillum sp.]
MLRRNGAVDKDVFRYIRWLVDSQTSPSQIDLAARACGLLYDFVTATQGVIPVTPKEAEHLTWEFRRALLHGTIQPDGSDLLGLGWRKLSVNSSQAYFRSVMKFAEFCHEQLGHESLPARKMDVWAVAGEMHRLRGSLLAHIRGRGTPKSPKHTVRGPSNPRGHGSAKSFPASHILPLIVDGCVVRGAAPTAPREQRFNIRDQLCFLLQAFGGIRSSELMHIFVNDIIRMPDGSARVLLYHPTEGSIRWRQRDTGTLVTKTREEYLMDKYGLVPRNLLDKRNPLHAGWKDLLLEEYQPNYYAVVHWINPDIGRLFWKLHSLYVEKIRPSVAGHPYYFVSLDESRLGDPLKLDAYKDRFDVAVRRIGLEPNRYQGVNPHGLRHFYGYLAINMGLSVQVVQAMMHHKSPLSQFTYTRPGEAAVNRQIEEGFERLSNAAFDSSSWKGLEQASLNNALSFIGRYLER